MKPFDGLLILDFSQVWAGPVSTRIMRDLGAQVIKIERPSRPDTVRIAYVAGNDTSGDYWNRAPYFHVRNAGKRGIMLELSSDEGMRAIHGLLARADVLVESFTPRVMEHFGLNWAKLHEQYPRLIMVSLCGYGQTGPKRNAPAFGMGMEPASGVSAVSGYVGEPPQKSGNTWVDALCGIHAAGALLAALEYRERTGRGQQIDVSMQEVVIQLTAPYFADYVMNGRIPPRPGNRRPGQVRGIYRCVGEDEWIAITARTEDEWRALCSAIRKEAWLTDPRLATMEGRWEHHDELDRGIEEWASARGKMEAMDYLQRHNVPAGAVLNSRDIIKNEHLISRHFWDTVEVPDFGPVVIQRYFPARVDGHGIGAQSRAPKLGEHTDEVLRELLGYDDAKLAELRDTGVTTGTPMNWAPPEAREILKQPIGIFLQTGAILGVDDRHREVVAETIAAVARAEP